MTQYIDKAAVVAEIDRLIERAKAERVLYPKTILSAKNLLLLEDYDRLKKFIDKIEVKEVDLDKELSMLDRTLFDLDGVAIVGSSYYLTVEDVKDIARHFFELGLKVQKGE